MTKTERICKGNIEHLYGMTYKSLVERYQQAMRILADNARLAGQWADLARLDQSEQYSLPRETFDFILVQIYLIERKRS